MKRVLSLLSLCALAACGGGGVGTDSLGALPTSVGASQTTATPLTGPVSKLQKENPEIVIDQCSWALWGDSIAHGSRGPYGPAQLDETPLQGLARMRPQWRGMDYTEPGTSAITRVQRFEETPITTRVVFLEYGINDSMVTEPIAYDNAMRRMVQHVWAAGSIPVITGLSYPTWPNYRRRDEFNAAAKAISDDTGVVFGYWDYVAYAEGDNNDVIHPKQAYSTRLTQRLAETLDYVAPDCINFSKP